MKSLGINKSILYQTHFIAYLRQLQGDFKANVLHPPFSFVFMNNACNYALR